MDQTPDLGEFLKLSRPRRPLCPVGIALEQLPENERAQLEAACAASKGVITNSAVVQWLAARGLKASISSLTAHRHATCTCHD